MKQFYHFLNPYTKKHIFLAADDVLEIREYDGGTRIRTSLTHYNLGVPAGLVMQNIIEGGFQTVVNIEVEPPKPKQKK